MEINEIIDEVKDKMEYLYQKRLFLKQGNIKVK